MIESFADSSRRVVVVDGCRTPFCRSGTAFTDLRSYDLGRMAVSGLLHRTRVDPAAVDLLVMGTVIADPATSNLGREVVLGPKAGDAFIVRSGLEEGERVVVEGNFKIDSALQATERQFIRLVGSCNRIAQCFVYPFSLPELDRSGETRDYISIATTRPETMLGDTAVAVHPEPARALDEAEQALGKVPFFVRGKARRNTENYALERGIERITLDTLYDAKAHYSH